MPVAKLSAEFYKRFGDKATDELVECLNTIESGYRAEIRDLFDAQFERYREFFERRLTETKAEIRQEIATSRQEIATLRAELLKWSVALWIPVALAVLGLYFR